MSFSFKSCRELKNKLGYSDSISELKEVLFREYEQILMDMDNTKKHIEEISTKHGIVVNFSNIDEVKVSLWKNYIVNAYSVAEVFLYEFRDEYCKIRNKNWSFNPEESKIKTIINSIVKGKNYQSKVSNFGEVEIALFEYYRHLRNNIIHSSEKSMKNVEREYERIIEYKDRIKVKYNIDLAPNSLNEIKYEDFNLFTRVMKNIAWELSIHGKPTYQEIAEIIDVKKYNHLKNNQKRFKNSFLTEIRTMYGYDELEAEEVFSLLKV